MKKNYLFSVAALCSAMLFVACSGQKETTEQAAIEETETVQLVKIARVTEQAVPQIANYTATIEPYKRNSISSSVPNRIKKIYVEVGDRVSAGQKLVELDHANLTQQRLQLENLEVEFNRVKELFAVGGASQQQVDQMRTQYETLKEAVENLDENTILTSPTNGVVTARNFDNGDMASGPILTVMQIQPVKVLVSISESDFTKVRVGMPVDVKVEVYGDEVFPGKVSLVHPTIDPATRTFVAEINIPNSDSRIRPGMFARVDIDFGAKNRVVVPDQAVIKRAGSGDRFVYVYKDGKVYFNQVELGRHIDKTYELISGVENGADVVIAGHTRLKDGAEVKVAE